MSGERACSRLVGGGQHGLTRGWVLVWEDSRWGIWEVGLGMRLGNWAETRSQRALESHCLSTSGAEGGFTRQLELESVGLVLPLPHMWKQGRCSEPGCLTHTCVHGHTVREQAWRTGTTGDIQSKLI